MSSFEIGDRVIIKSRHFHRETGVVTYTDGEVCEVKLDRILSYISQDENENGIFISEDDLDHFVEEEPSKFWMVMGEGVMYSSSNWDSVEQYASSLSEMNPNCKYFILEAVQLFSNNSMTTL